MEKSILPEEMRGVAFLGGRRGLGKTFLAAQVENPALVLFLNYDSRKGEGIHNQLKFGEYHDLTAEAAGSGNIGLWNKTVEVINKVPKDRFTVAIIDNVSPLELAMKAEAMRGIAQYTKEFGLSRANVENNRYGGDKSIVNFLITEKITAPLFAKGIQLIVATAHVKPPWVNGAPVPNKWNAKGADRWQEISVLTLILIPGDYPPTPSAIVQKEQLGSIVFDAALGDFTMSRRLPARIARCTFSEIRRYLREPADLNDPKPGEVLSHEEYFSYSDELSKEQLAMVQAYAQLAIIEAKNEEAGTRVERGLFEGQEADLDTLKAPDATPMTDAIKARIKEIYAANGNAGALDIKKVLGDEGVTVAMPQVLAVLKEIKQSA